jgi:hypothetical protein
VFRVILEIIGILLLPLAGAFVYTAALFLGETAEEWLLAPFGIGFGVYLLLYLILLNTRFSFVETFEHELNHLVMGKLFLKDSKELLVTADKGGHMDFRVNSNNFFIALAPYTIPLFTIPLLIARLFLPPPISLVLDFLIGFTLAFHLVGLCKEFRPRQTDLQRSGYAFSVSAVLIVNAIWLVVAVAVVIDDPAAIGTYFSDAIALAGEFYQQTVDFLGGLLGF